MGSESFRVRQRAMVNLGNEWDALLDGEFKKDYYLKLRQKLKEEYSARTVYPDMHDIFNALKYTSYNAVKVVILGQDPYHGPGQAHGLSFSVQDGIRKPPSLENIFKELQNDLGFAVAQSGSLKKWALEGALLLNASLTVRAGEPNSHQSIGWEIFTDKIIELLNEREKGMVFLLWGANAKQKARFVTNPQHKLLTAPHPSPFSADGGFFGCRHFSKANEYLISIGQTPVDWNLAQKAV